MLEIEMRVSSLYVIRYDHLKTIIIIVCLYVFL